MAGILTRAPEDIYGEDAWFHIIFDVEYTALPKTVEEANELKIPYVHWSILNDKERDAVWITTNVRY